MGKDLANILIFSTCPQCNPSIKKVLINALLSY